MRYLILMAVSAISISAASAAEPEKKPAEVIKEIVDSAKRAPDGTMQPSTGRAKPVENWFGCKPGEASADCKKGATEKTPKQ